MPQTPPTALAASSLATAAQHDPQMRAPDHPRLIRGVSRVHIRDGLLVVGGADRVFLRGTFATESLGGILDLLDGTRGVTELAEETNLSVQAVNAAISLLYAKGLIEDARAGAPADVSEPVLNALSRRAPLTRMRASGEEAAQALVDTRFLLIGEEGQLRIDDVAALLKKTGARHVEIMS